MPRSSSSRGRGVAGVWVGQPQLRSVAAVAVAVSCDGVRSSCVVCVSFSLHTCV